MGRIKSIAIKIMDPMTKMIVKKFIPQKPQWLSNPWFLGATIFYGAMFILGSVRSLERTFIWTFNDKLLHFTAYFVLTALIYLGLKTRPIGELFFPRSLATLAIVAGAGALDEIAQYFVGRDSSFDDWVADTAAAVVLLILVALVHGLIWTLEMYRQSISTDESGGDL